MLPVLLRWRQTRHRSLCPGHRVHDGCEQRLHDAGGHAAECNRVRNRLVRMPQMMKAGIWLNLAGILVITALCALLL